jgi:hypothetical protein
MERRFSMRKREMLAECEVSPRVFLGMAQRLAEFVEPFAECLGQPAQREHAAKYLAGLLSDLKRKNVESIAYRHDEDRRNLQHFIGTANWDHRAPGANAGCPGRGLHGLRHAAGKPAGRRPLVLA